MSVLGLIFLEFLVAKLIGYFMSLLMLGAAHAAEIADVPVTEPNYVGIIVFLGLFVVVGVWFMWKIMRNKGDGK
jgi:phosphate/sulfate permease